METANAPLPFPVRAAPEVYSFEGFALEVRERRLLQEGREIQLPPKHFDLLVALVRRQGRLATKDELLSEVWNDATVAESSLSQAVSQLRRALDGPRRKTSLIATVTKAGYRLAAPVKVLDALPRRPTPVPQATPLPFRRSAQAPPPEPRRPLARFRLVLAGTLTAVLATAAVLLVTRTAPAPRAGLPGQPEARRLFLDGERLLRAGDVAQARRLLERSLELDAGSPLAHAELAAALSALDEVRLAGEAAARAASLAERLPEPDRRWIAARAAAAEHRWEVAVPELGRLFGRYPERLEYGLDLVAAQLASGHGAVAMVTVGRLRQLPAPASQDPRIDLVEAEAAVAVCEYQGAAVAAVRARERAAALGAAALGLRARELHAQALRRLDQIEAATEELTAVREEAGRTGDRGAEARAVLGLAALAHREADAAEARELQADALARVRELGDSRREIEALGGWAQLLAEAGDFAAAQETAEQAVALSREIADLWSEGEQLAQLATVLNFKGDFEAAVGVAEQALPKLRESANRRRLLATLTNLALSGVERGEAARVRAYLDEAETLAREVGTPANLTYVLRARGYLAETQGDRAAARRLYGQALETARGAGAEELMASLLYDLAVIEAEDGDPALAARQAAEAEALSRRGGDLRAALQAGAVLALAEARGGDLEAARRRIARLRGELADPDWLSARQVIASCEADVAEVAGDWRRVLEAQAESLAIAEQWGATSIVLNTRLAMARAYAGLGETERAASLAREVLDEARRSGLPDVAERARTLAEPASPLPAS